MQSQKYCTKCQCFHIKRIKRGFVKKVVLRHSPLYQCSSCNHLFNEKEMRSNEMRRDTRLLYPENAHMAIETEESEKLSDEEA